MALFDKLFSLKRRLDSDNCEPRDRGRSCQINPEQVRLLLFKECDWRGRRLLFDSSAIQKVPAGKNDKPTIRKTDEAPCIVEVSDGYTYLYKGPEADATILGEMIFGAVAMKSVSFKIHIMDEPRRLMCTKVFCVPVSRRISRVERRTSDRLDASVRSASKPLTVPSGAEGVSLSFSLDRGDSGFCGDHSPYSSASSTYDYFSMFETWEGNESQEDFYSFHSLSGRKLSTSSNGSWQRRTFQNIATRFDLGQSSQLLSLPTGNATNSDSQIYSNSSTSGTSDSLVSGTASQRKYKLGLAVLITVTDSVEMDVVRRCVEHSPQIQALVCRLRVAAMSCRGGTFASSLHRAAGQAATWLSDLIYGPRLQPVWLSLVTQDARASHKLADSLMDDLCAVLAVGDTKATHFFISTLLTHVLTYHLGWVTTVSPYDTVEHKNLSHERKRPYNAMWAQLSDLSGSIGYPSRAARTILCGEKHSQFINKLLVVLTYFVRCGDVTRSVFKYQDCPIEEVKTILVQKVPVDTHSDSASTLVSDVSFKRSTTLANLSQKLSSSELGGTSGHNSSGLRRNPTMMHSLKASSDSSLNSTASDESAPQQVLFVLGDNDKLVGLKNKSNGGRSVKRSSKPNEPTDQKECVKPSSGPDSPSKCCGLTLQHSKPIKHSGFKFEFDKYPQIVTNYMKSKNLEILDRHYIGKPGNLKLDNFQFDPTIVPPIQEERCETCVKCQMESMLQTPTNASEMEYMNDMPRTLEPQYAKQKVVTEMDKREMSPKTFVRRRKNNTVVVNLAHTKSLSDSEVNCETKEKERERKNSAADVCSNILLDKGMPTIRIIKIPQSSSEDSMPGLENYTDAKISADNLKREGSLRSSKSKLKSTKSMGNLNLLVPLEELLDTVTTEYSTNDPRISDSKNSSNKVHNMSPNDSKSASSNDLSQSSNHGSKSPVSSNESTIPAEIKTVSSNELKYAVSSEITSSIDSITPISDEQKTISSVTSPANDSSSDSLTKISAVDSTISSSYSKSATSPTDTKSTENPTLLGLKMAETRRHSRETPTKTIEVKRVIEFPLPKMCATESGQRAGFDLSLLGGLTDHYVPDLILQGTLAKPDVWEFELRRDLDLTSYLNKTMDAPAQAVAIIGDTNTWEVRVVGRDCGTSGMSSLVATMLDAVPAMWKAKVPAPQCLSFIESKLREFCVLSKTVADMLMSTDFCDIATLTKSLNIDVNDVPLLLAVATTHTPQVATRYGISYR